MFRVKLITALVMGATVWPTGAYAVSGPVAPVVPNAVRVEASAPQDLRSVEAGSAVSPSRSAPSASDGFEWSDAEIGASVVLALAALASGMVLLAGRSRRRAPTT
jgi:hypothetical protein